MAKISGGVKPERKGDCSRLLDGEIVALDLEKKLDAELHLARRLGAKDPSEVGCEGDAVRHVEIHAIQQVEHLPSKLQAYSAAKGHVLLKR